MVQHEWTKSFDRQGLVTPWGSAHQGQPMAPPGASTRMSASCDHVSPASGERPYADPSGPSAYCGAEPQQGEASEGSPERADSTFPVEYPEGRWQLQSPEPRQQRYGVPAVLRTGIGQARQAGWPCFPGLRRGKVRGDYGEVITGQQG